MKLRALLLAACCGLLLFADDHPKPAPASPDQLWQDLSAGNARFVAGHPQARNLPADRAKWAKIQSPPVAVLACADSRVAPELVFDKTLGDLFVVRAAGNSPDPLAIGSLEYAVEHLGTVMIVVMGHQSCGAVKAACSGEKMPTTNLEAVVKPIQASCSKAKGKDVEPATRDHVHQAALALVAHSPILKKRVEEKKLTIVESYYSLDTGKVERLR
ncbi:MAG TPA: carbonic anhydrase [Terriglobales bacterium]|nr:carbonic anhydrase [Terriglobales bacterium]